MTLEIREQPRLSLRRQVDLCVDGIQHRLARALITLAVVALAIAFLSNILTESLIVQSLGQHVDQVDTSSRSLDRLLFLLRKPMTDRQLIAQLSSLAHGQSDEKLLRNWCACDDATWLQIQNDSRHADALMQWLDAQRSNVRRQLQLTTVTPMSPMELSESSAVTQLLKRLDEMPELRPSLEIKKSLPLFSKLNPTISTLLTKVNSHIELIMHDEQAQKTIAGLSGDASIALAQNDLQSFCVQHQIPLTPQELKDLQQEAASRQQTLALLTTLRDPALPVAWRKSLGKFDADAAVIQIARDENAAQLIVEFWPKTAPVIDAQTVTQLCRSLQTLRKAQQIRSSIDATYGQQIGLHGSALWLILISLLVSIVGVTNAMLVSVLERFREIATMKCLGGLDSFIATLFLMEAALVGVVGGIAGVLAGTAVGMARMTWVYGSWALSAAPWWNLCVSGLVAAAIGIAITSLAAVYPAIKAASLPPMEAMRVA